MGVCGSTILPNQSAKKVSDISISYQGPKIGNSVECSKLFLSYNLRFRADQVDKTADFLQNEGFGYYKSINIERLYARIPEQLTKAISDVDLVIIFISSDYQKFVNCKSEATFVLEKKKPVVLVYLERDLEIAPWLQEIINSAKDRIEFFTSNTGEFHQQLLESINRILKPPQNLDNKMFSLHDIAKLIQTIHVPFFPADKYYKRRDVTDENVLEVICEACQHPEKGFKLLTGDDGVGKTTLIAHVLNDKQNLQKLAIESGINTVLWINCYDLADLFKSGEIEAAENAFTSKVLSAAKEIPVDVAPNYHTVCDVISQFRKEERKFLFILDDVFHVKLLQYFLKCHKELAVFPCCVITRDSLPSQLNEAQVVFSEFKIPFIGAEEIAVILGTTFKLREKIGEDKILKLANDSICCGLPLIATLLAGQFNASSDYETTYQVLMSSLGSIGKLDVSNKDRPLKTVNNLVDFSLNQMSDLLQKRYHALLFFDPFSPISPSDVSLLWSFDRDEEPTIVLKEFYDNRCLVSIAFSNRNGNQQQNEFDFSIHQMIHSSALDHAIRVYNLQGGEDVLPLLRYNIVTGLAWHNGPREMIMFESVRKFRHPFLRQIIARLNAENLITLCLQNSTQNNESGNTFFHFLYNFEQWPDNLKHPTGHILEKCGRNISYRLLEEILSKINRSKNCRNLLKQIAANETGPVEASSFMMSLFDDEKTDSQYWERRPLINILYPWRNFYEETKWKRTALSNSGGAKNNAELVFAAVRGSFEGVKRLFARQPMTRDQLRDGFQIAARCNSIKVLRFLFRKDPKLISETDENGQTSLHFAVQGGHFDVVRFLIEQGESGLISLTDKNGLTALDFAAKCGHPEIARYLFERDPTLISEVSGEGKTVLHYAAENGHLEICRYLVEKCQSLMSMADENGWTAVHFAVKNGQVDVVRYLVEKDGKLAFKVNSEGRSVLHYASEDGQIDLVRYLVEKEPKMVAMLDEDGWTAFHCASANGHIDVVRYLLERDENLILKEDGDGWTALHCAARSGHLETVRYLVEHDPTSSIISKASNYKETALHFASVSGQIEIVCYLTEKAPKKLAEDREHGFLSIEDDDGWTALHCAAANGHLEIVRYLIEKDPNLANDSTALHAAAQGGHCDVINVLLETSPSLIFVTDTNGLTPLHYASRGGNIEAVRLVAEKDPNALPKIDGSKKTCLHYAAACGHNESVRYLAEQYPGLILLLDDDGRTAFHFAAANGHLSVVSYLFEKEPILISLVNKSGLTALHFATESGHIDVVTFLIERDPTFRAIAEQNGRNGFVKVKQRNSLQRQEEAIPEVAIED